MKTKNYFIFILFHLMIALSFFQISRWIFYFYNFSFFEQLDFNGFFNILQGGFIFDLISIFYLNSLFVLLGLFPSPIRNFLYKKNIFLFLFIFFNSLGWAANLIDVAYFPFSLKRTDFSIFKEFGNQGAFFSLFKAFLIDYYWLFFIFILGVYGLYYLSKKIKIEENFFFNKKNNHQKIFYLLKEFSILILNLIFIVSTIRGNLLHSTRPLSISNAAKYASNQNIPLVLNTPFVIFRTINRIPLPDFNFYKNENEILNFYKTNHNQNKENKNSIFNQKNIVIIILESFSREHIGFFNQHIPDYKGFTPFFDQLAAKSISFEHAFANGRKSIDALPAILGSIPSLENPFILSTYSNNKTEGLPYLLKEKGYYSSFFHGAPNGSMGFDALMKALDVDQYFGMNEYNNDADYDGFWGIWDLPFFQFTADKINELPTPFLATMFSLSSHHPYQIPKELEGKFPKGNSPLQPTIAYTDYALELFFKKIEKMPWFENTLFVLTADHTNAETVLAEYQNAAGYFKIPLLFYDPSKKNAKKIPELAQQIDIFPTILSYLNYPDPYFAFGQPLLDTNGNFMEPQPHFAINYFGNNYQFFSKNYLLISSGYQASALFDYQKDLLLEKNLLSTEKEKINSLQDTLQAFLQNYTEKMKKNKLFYDDSKEKYIEK